MISPTCSDSTHVIGSLSSSQCDFLTGSDWIQLFLGQFKLIFVQFMSINASYGSIWHISAGSS